MPLDIQSQQQFVQNEIATIQASLTGTFNFQPGSIILALTQAHARTGIWLESLIQYVLSITRLATSTGMDVDSFVEDFGLFRLEGAKAEGSVSFTSYSTTQQRIIPANSVVSTLSSAPNTSPSTSVSFIVIADTTQPTYDPALNAYVMDIGVSTVSATVECQLTGFVGNVTANTITVINSPIVGVDLVTNPAGFTTGQEAQTDQQLRQAFILYLGSLSRATKAAIQYSIELVQTGLLYVVIENVDYTTQATRLGYFYAIVDDGSGSPPSSLLTAVSISINLYRGLTIAYEVKAPVVINADITANIVLPAGFSSATLISTIGGALISYIITIPMGGGTLFYNRLPQVIYNAILTEINNNQEFLDTFHISILTLNGSTSDLVSSTVQAIRAGTLAITTSYS